jgi:hypothetical protein
MFTCHTWRIKVYTNKGTRVGENVNRNEGRNEKQIAKKKVNT